MSCQAEPFTTALAERGRVKSSLATVDRSGTRPKNDCYGNPTFESLVGFSSARDDAYRRWIEFRESLARSTTGRTGGKASRGRKRQSRRTASGQLSQFSSYEAACRSTVCEVGTRPNSGLLSVPVSLTQRRRAPNKRPAREGRRLSHGLLVPCSSVLSVDNSLKRKDTHRVHGSDRPSRVDWVPHSLPDDRTSVSPHIPSARYSRWTATRPPRPSPG